MYDRFVVFEGKPDTGFVILSCELIDNNGRELLNCVEKYIKLWDLSDEFLKWIREENIFCSTLVDRIVTGSAPSTEWTNKRKGASHLLDKEGKGRYNI